MFELPDATIVDKRIPLKKILIHTNPGMSIQTLMTEQVREIRWMHKLSPETFGLHAASGINELELFQIQTINSRIDQRVLRQIDRGIPYYILHTIRKENLQQIWIAEKRIRSNGNVQVVHYERTKWLEESEMDFSFKGKTAEDLQHNLLEEVRSKSLNCGKSDYHEEQNDFLHYLQTMNMSYSYKIVLMLALMHFGGSVSVSQAAAYFRKFYNNRAKSGQIVEKDNSIYCNPDTEEQTIIKNIITNPIEAFMHSGFFNYDKDNQEFSIKAEIYDALTLEEIDRIIEICRERLQQYYNRFR